MTDQEYNLILGAKIGQAFTPLYIHFLRGNEGTQAQLMEQTDMGKTSIESGVRRLKDMKLIRVTRWVNIQSAVYALGSEPDAKRPSVSRNILAAQKTVNNQLAAAAKVRDRIDKLLEEGERTLYGTRVKIGNVTTHKLRD